jgi:pimeloyl-ACP methyl ester carboxylesterase
MRPATTDGHRSRRQIVYMACVSFLVVGLGASVTDAVPGSAAVVASQRQLTHHFASLQAVSPHAVKPTIVLVHGAWADSSSWNGVVAQLQRRGYRVRVPPVPLRSLAGDAAGVAAFIATIPGPLVLVGHSYGGGVITNMGRSDPDVRALVYVDAFAPERGEVLSALSGPDSALAVDPSTVFDFVPIAGGRPGDVDIYLKKKIFVNAFANDIPRRQADVLWATQRPVTGSAGNEPSGAPAWKTLPSWYVLGTRDLIIPPSAQRAMALRAGSTLVRLHAGHLSLISRPNAVAAVIVAAALATAR